MADRVLSGRACEPDAQGSDNALYAIAALERRLDQGSASCNALLQLVQAGTACLPCCTSSPSPSLQHKTIGDLPCNAFFGRKLRLAPLDESSALPPRKLVAEQKAVAERKEWVGAKPKPVAFVDMELGDDSSDEYRSDGNNSDDEHIGNDGEADSESEEPELSSDSADSLGSELDLSAPPPRRSVAAAPAAVSPAPERAAAEAKRPVPAAEVKQSSAASKRAPAAAEPQRPAAASAEQAERDLAAEAERAERELSAEESEDDAAAADSAERQERFHALAAGAAPSEGALALLSDGKDKTAEHAAAIKLARKADDPADEVEAAFNDVQEARILNVLNTVNRTRRMQAYNASELLTDPSQTMYQVRARCRFLLLRCRHSSLFSCAGRRNRVL